MCVDRGPYEREGRFGANVADLAVRKADCNVGALGAGALGKLRDRGLHVGTATTFKVFGRVARVAHLGYNV